MNEAGVCVVSGFWSVWVGQAFVVSGFSRTWSIAFVVSGFSRTGST